MCRTIIRRPKVQERTGLSCSTIYQLISENAFPKQVRLGKRSVGWYEDEIDEWIESRTLAGNPSC